jgi:hypothetical protein
MARPRLVLIYEPEEACRTYLAAQGFAGRQALEISSYLAQCTDIALEFGEIERACATRGLDFEPVELDNAAATLPRCDPGRTIVWTLSDGVAYFRGSAGPALARLNGLPTIGSDDSLFALCQDKFRSGAVLQAHGLPVPPSGLARDGVWLAEPPASPSGWSSSRTGSAPRSASGRIRAARTWTMRWNSAAGFFPPTATMSSCSLM